MLLSRMKRHMENMPSWPGPLSQNMAESSSPAVGRYVQLEGKDRPRNVVAKFDSVEAAEACYHSPEYQEALSHARNASERELLIVETDE